MTRKKHTPEEIERRAKIRELLQMSNVSRFWGKRKAGSPFRISCSVVLL